LYSPLALQLPWAALENLGLVPAGQSAVSDEIFFEQAVAFSDASMQAGRPMGNRQSTNRQEQAKERVLINDIRLDDWITKD
jgi:hypothetical protein